jgi:transcription elongation factor Elf1
MSELLDPNYRYPIDRSIKKAKRKTVEDMITCPMCGAMSYPIITMKEPPNQDEMQTMICKSCNDDIIPYLEAYKEYTLVRENQRIEEQAAKAVDIAEELGDKKVSTIDFVPVTEV